MVSYAIEPVMSVLKWDLSNYLLRKSWQREG